ncbi:MAG: hypothetical protein ACON49_07520 [Candidatus Puniceispirillaceae bacterium]
MTDATAISAFVDSLGDDATGSSDAVSYGLQYSIGDISLRLAQNTSTTEDDSGATTVDTSSLGFGLNFAVSPDLKLGFYSADCEDKGGADDATIEFSESAVSLTYTVAPGLSTNLSYTDYENGDKSGSNTAAYIKVAF